jgi:hypothetical protein
MAVRTGTS